MLTQPLMEGAGLYDEQRALEQEYIDQGVRRYRRQAQQTIDRGEGSNLKSCDRLLTWWYPKILARLNAEAKSIASGEPGKGRIVYGGTFLKSDPKRLSVITMHTVLSELLREPKGISRTALIYRLGRNAVSDVLHERLRKESPSDFKAMRSRWKRLTDPRIVAAARKVLEDEVFQKKACVYLGAVLFKHAAEKMLVPVGDDQFKPVIRQFQDRRRMPKAPIECQLSEECLEWIDNDLTARASLHPAYGFMSCPPMAWVQGEDGEVVEGGYLTIRTPLVARPTLRQKRAVKDAGLAKQLEAINTLGRTPWVINERVLEVAKAEWECGGGDLGMPRRDDPPKPPYPTDGSEDEIRAWKREAAVWHEHRIRAVSHRFDLYQKFTLAERWAGRKLYQPHRMDFRGRCYPIPAFLNHQGDDLCRGLMLFAEDRPFSWDWVAVEAANAFGMDKLSFDGRRAWVRENHRNIVSIVDTPGETSWWRQADKPWQFLAACFALVHEDGRLPIKMDGSANGLQHYAALGRDSVAAPHLNLVPQDKPGDLYTAVLNRLSDDLSPAERGVVDRSVVKQPVMTLPYGVTAHGMREQMASKLRDRMEPKDAIELAHKVQPRVREAIGDTVRSAFEIMEWLESCARIMLKERQFVRWTTRLGMPVVQPYERHAGRKLKTALREIQIRLDSGNDPPKDGRHLRGVAPNFIHSLDATHMLMVALRMDAAGHAFAGVHDSYWTHGDSVDHMNRIIREEFVSLHSRPILHDLRAEWQSYCNATLPLPPGRGDLELLDVINAGYFFS